MYLCVWRVQLFTLWCTMYIDNKLLCLGLRFYCVSLYLDLMKSPDLLLSSVRFIMLWKLRGCLVRGCVPRLAITYCWQQWEQSFWSHEHVIENNSRSHSRHFHLCSVFKMTRMKSVNQKSMEFSEQKFSVLQSAVAWSRVKLLHNYCSMFYHFHSKERNESIFL